MTDERPPEGTPAPSGEPPPLAQYVSPTTAAPAAPPPPQPAVTWAAPPAAAAAVQGGRTMIAAAAGIVLLVLGILGGLLGLLVAFVGGSFVSSLDDLGYFPELEGGDASALFGGIVAFFGVVVVIYSLVYLIGGIGVLRSRGWGRVMGIVVGIISGAFWLLGVVSPNAANQGNLGFAIVMLAIHAFILVALLMFWRTRVAAA